MRRSCCARLSQKHKAYISYNARGIGTHTQTHTHTYTHTRVYAHTIMASPTLTHLQICTCLCLCNERIQQFARTSRSAHVQHAVVLNGLLLLGGQGLWVGRCCSYKVGGPGTGVAGAGVAAGALQHHCTVYLAALCGIALQALQIRATDAFLQEMSTQSSCFAIIRKVYVFVCVCVCACVCMCVCALITRENRTVPKEGEVYARLRTSRERGPVAGCFCWWQGDVG